MVQTNPFDQFDTPTQANPFDSIPLTGIDPARQFAGPQAQANLRRTQQQVALDAATYDAERRTALANATAAEANAQIATSKAREAGMSGVSLNPELDRLTGNEYLSRLPTEIQAQVRALSDGRLAFPSGAALRSPYWQQMLQHVAHFDPQFDAINYNSRAATRRDFVAGKSAQNIRALNTAIGHLGQLNEQIQGTANSTFTPYNALSNTVSDMFGATGPALFNQTAGALASELTQVFRGSGGAVSDIQRELEHLTPSGSLAQKQATVRNIAGLLKSRLDSLSDQYQQGVGTTGDPIQMLNPHAKDAYAVLSRLGPTSGGSGGNGGPGLAGVGAGGPNMPPPGAPQLATGATRGERNPELERALNGLLRSGADIGTLNATSRAMGGGDLDAAQVAQARQWLQSHPDYRGSLFDTTHDVPTTAWQRIAASPVGAGALAALDAGLGGTTDEIASVLGGGNLQDINARKEALFRENPGSAFAGQIAGSIAGIAGISAATRAASLPGFLARPITADIAFGALSGAGQANDNRLLGAGIGGIAGAAGNVAGQGIGMGVGALARTRPGLSLLNTTRGVMGRAPIANPGLSPADAAAGVAVNRAGLDGVRGALDEAVELNVPMSLADTNPNLRELGGAAVRRSPTASQFAEDAYIPRNRGQYDRFSQAVERDLGPIGNIPQLSERLTREAQDAARPIYEQAYRQPVTATPELESLLQTPFGRSATSRAQTIAANERRNPMEMGFVQDADGTVRLNPNPTQQVNAVVRARADLDAAQAAYRDARNSPSANLDSARTRLENAREGLRQAEASLNTAPRAGEAMRQPGYTTQTLDYVKRGMDDVLEQYRNPITNRLQLDEAGRAQNNVRAGLVNEVDRLNNTYRQARQVYQGPVASRDALMRGQDAYSMNPDVLSQQVAGQTPEHLGQMQMGYRDTLIQRAKNVRDTSNPFEATLGTPATRERLDILYPNSPGVPRLLRTRDLEGSLQQTSNAILGNSRTARNQIADRAFLENPAIQAGADLAASAMTGGVPVATMMRTAASRGVRDAVQFGVGQRAVAKADDLAPLLFNTNPLQSRQLLDELMLNNQRYQQLIEATTPRRRLGMFGAVSASNAALLPVNQGQP